jgi:CRP-like cAMP-binding protein
MLPITRYTTSPVIRHRPSVLSESVLSSSLGAEDLDRLESLGELVTVPSGAAVFEAGERATHLYVVVSGTLAPAAPADAPRYWVGPGDLCGEGGFVLGSPRGTTMVAAGPDALVWRLRRSVLAHLALPRGVVATRLLGAIARTIEARLAAPHAVAASWTEADYCDEHHPAVTAMAARLARRTPEETAWAIWAAVSKLPYRFGPWQWRASDTLARGHGTSTAKAVLQIALMRALGIPCGYVAGEIDSALVQACLPQAYAPRGPTTRLAHYHAAGRLQGRWTALDASFSPDALAMIAEAAPQVRPLVDWDPAASDGLARWAASIGGADPGALAPSPDLGDIMRLPPPYDAKNADAMNVVLDRAQGYAPPRRPYVAMMERALATGSALAARAAVMDGLEADLAELRARGR